MPILIPLALNIGFIYRYLKDLYSINKSAKIILIFHYIIIITIGLSFVIVKIYILDFSISFIDVLLAISSIVMILKLFNLKSFPFIKINVITLLTLIFSISNSPTLIKTTNKNYKSINKLNSSSVKVYTNYSLSPEIIWDFGTKINQLNDIELKTITKKKMKFGMLTKNPISSTDTIINRLRYTIKLISKYDLNSTNKKSRLITYYHLFSPE